jgi:hypothetical protein
MRDRDRSWIHELMERLDMRDGDRSWIQELNQELDIEAEQNELDT